MPLIVSPRQLRQRGELYHQLDQLVSAGITLVKALEIQYNNPPGHSFRKPLRHVLDLLQQGSTFAEALRQTGGWVPAFDIALLQAGENSGRLDQCFRLLSQYYQERAQMARQMMNDMAYPTLLLHMAVFIFPFPNLFMGGSLFSYALQTLGVLIPIYVVVGLLIYAAQSGHGEQWRARLEKILRPIPLLGTARHYLALARLAVALEALLNSGVGLIEAWSLAAAASGSPALRQTVAGWKPNLLAGQTPAELVRTSSLFPDAFSNLYTTGEVSGKLDDSLRGLHRYYQEDGSNKMHLVAQWTPRIVYGIIAGMIAYRIIAFYAGYVQQIRDAGGF
jgi:type II secretory pathway component PulF